MTSSRNVCAGRIQLDVASGTESFLEDGCSEMQTAALVSESLALTSVDSREANSPEQDFLKMKTAAKFVQSSSHYLSVETVTGVRFDSNRTIVTYRSSTPGKGTCQITLYSMKMGQNFNFQYVDSKPTCHIR
jgi:hypothetical protein